MREAESRSDARKVPLIIIITFVLPSTERSYRFYKWEFARYSDAFLCVCFIRFFRPILIPQYSHLHRKTSCRGACEVKEAGIAISNTRYLHNSLIPNKLKKNPCYVVTLHGIVTSVSNQQLVRTGALSEHLTEFSLQYTKSNFAKNLFWVRYVVSCLKEQCRLHVFEHKVIRKISGPK